MPLIKQNLITAFEPFFDQDSPNFISFPKDIPEAAQKWSDAVNLYASFVTPVSSTSQVARSAYYTTFLGMNNQNGDQILQTAFMQYALQLGLGMVGYVATPPANPINLSPVYTLGRGGAKNSDCLTLLCDIVDIWFKTGLAVQISSGVSQPWM